jgi:hypothetical protein
VQAKPRHKSRLNDPTATSSTAHIHTEQKLLPACQKERFLDVVGWVQEATVCTLQNELNLEVTFQMQYKFIASCGIKDARVQDVMTLENERYDFITDEWRRNVWKTKKYSKFPFIN